MFLAFLYVFDFSVQFLTDLTLPKILEARSCLEQSLNLSRILFSEGKLFLVILVLDWGKAARNFHR